MSMPFLGIASASSEAKIPSWIRQESFHWTLASSSTMPLVVVLPSCHGTLGFMLKGLQEDDPG